MKYRIEDNQKFIKGVEQPMPATECEIEQELQAEIDRLQAEVDELIFDRDGRDFPQGYL